MEMHKKPEISYILLACCTCKRPNMLRKSLESVKKLVLPESIKTELLVIDNDENFGAKNLIEEISSDFGIKINYFIEPERGISNARNKLLKEALNLGASHIAMFDDDEILDKNWLISHYNYYNQNPEAIIISGPTYNTFEKKYPKYIEKNHIFKSTTTKKTGLKREICASGNVFFPTTIMSEANIYFDTNYIFMGGEDGDFFSRAAKAGFTIVWNNEAINKELIGDERANLKWILNRHYYNGYSGVFMKCAADSRLTNILKYFLVLVSNFVLVPFSIFFGLNAFFNMLGMTCKTKGKLDAAISRKPLNYYQNICGN